MPRAKKTDRFGISNTPRERRSHGERMVFPNSSHPDQNPPNLYELVRFLEDKGVDLRKVPIPGLPVLFIKN